MLRGRNPRAAQPRRLRNRWSAADWDKGRRRLRPALALPRRARIGAAKAQGSSIGTVRTSPRRCRGASVAHARVTFDFVAENLSSGLSSWARASPPDDHAAHAARATIRRCIRSAKRSVTRGEIAQLLQQHAICRRSSGITDWEAQRLSALRNPISAVLVLARRQSCRALRARRLRPGIPSAMRCPPGARTDRAGVGSHPRGNQSPVEPSRCLRARPDGSRWPPCANRAPG